ncbi:MAG: prepilin-type N-terminal cleavage/methylation domain-containing protein [Myxococcota bacterium]|jgi:prepilin-type N-terminal cleavage/methylation domain-containing protein
MHRKLILRHRAGLTLIDLMVTIAILGVLMAVLASGTMRVLERDGALGGEDFDTDLSSLDEGAR